MNVLTSEGFDKVDTLIVRKNGKVEYIDGVRSVVGSIITKRGKKFKVHINDTSYSLFPINNIEYTSDTHHVITHKIDDAMNHIIAKIGR
jgi:hypothetical protein